MGKHEKKIREKKEYIKKNIKTFVNNVMFVC